MWTWESFWCRSWLEEGGCVGTQDWHSFGHTGWTHPHSHVEMNCWLKTIVACQGCTLVLGRWTDVGNPVNNKWLSALFIFLFNQYTQDHVCLSSFKEMHPLSASSRSLSESSKYELIWCANKVLPRSVNRLQRVIFVSKEAHIKKEYYFCLLQQDIDRAPCGKIKAHFLSVL